MTGKKNLIIVSGATASGKTVVAMEIAEKLGTGVISADSRQVYREMKIGTAVPDPEQLSRVPHHLIGHRSVTEEYNASIFENEAIAVLEEIFLKNDFAVMAGGSGLYIDAVCNGIDDLPTVSKEVRAQMKQFYRESGLEAIRAKLRQVDEQYYLKADLNNPSRILKALEVHAITGRPYSSFLTQPKKKRNFSVIKIGLDIDRKVLYDRINSRVDAMVEKGLVEEARFLLPLRGVNALNTVGYKELFLYFDNLATLDEAIEQVKSHTRQYARRQLTWFRKDREIKWFDPERIGEIVDYITGKTIANGDPGAETL